MIASPGIYALTAEAYHADPCEQPSLSASIATILCERTPLHAWHAHPRLNPEHASKDEAKFDVGTVAHAMLLQGQDIAVVCDYKDWRTNAAQAERDAARAAGQVPLLAKDWAAVQEMVREINLQLIEHTARPRLFLKGKPEQTIMWEEDGVTCRALADWLHDDFTAIDDLKTTSRSASPETWTRTLFGIGSDIQVAWYLRGVKALTGLDAEFRFCVVENYPPYALSVVSLSPHALLLAQAKVDYAIATWRRCIAANDWPGYGNRIAHAEPPAYMETQWLEREAREEMAV